MKTLGEPQLVAGAEPWTLAGPSVIYLDTPVVRCYYCTREATRKRPAMTVGHSGSRWVCVEHALEPRKMSLRVRLKSSFSR